MARVNSKYFADIIAKFLEAKRKETIVVDAVFREELRTKLMARAMEVSSESEQTVEDEVTRDRLPDSAPIDWLGLVKRFRYAFALVPSALLVVLVSSYVMNLPVNVGSEVVVPTATDTNNMAKPLFTGEGSLEENEDQATETVDEGQVVLEDGELEDNNDVDASVSEPEAMQIVQPSQQTVSTPVQDEQSVQSFDEQMPEYLEDFDRMNVPSAPASAFVPLKQVEPKTPTITPVQPVQEEATSEVVSTPAETKSVEVTAPVSTPKVNNSTVVPVIPKEAPVYYYTNLSTIEKENLKDQINNTVDQTNASEIYVYSLSGDVLEVVVKYLDGTSITKNLRKIADTGAFDDVSSSVDEEKAVSEPVIVPSVPTVNDVKTEEPVIYVPPSVPSGYYGPIDYEVLLDYDKR